MPYGNGSPPPSPPFQGCLSVRKPPIPKGELEAEEELRNDVHYRWELSDEMCSWDLTKGMEGFRQKYCDEATKIELNKKLYPG